MQTTATARDRVLPRGHVHPAQELSSELQRIIQTPDDELSVDVDLVDLEQGAATASDNVFLQPTPPELCPWGVALEKPGAIPPVNVIQVGQREELNNEALPRFSLVGRDSSRYGAEVASATLPRFVDCF